MSYHYGSHWNMFFFIGLFVLVFVYFSLVSPLSVECCKGAYTWCKNMACVTHTCGVIIPWLCRLKCPSPHPHPPPHTHLSPWAVSLVTITTFVGVRKRVADPHVQRCLLALSGWVISCRIQSASLSNLSGWVVSCRILSTSLPDLAGRVVSCKI